MIEINLRPGQKRARGGSPFAGLQAQLSGLRERMRDPLPLVAAAVVLLAVAWLGWSWLSTGSQLRALEPQLEQARQALDAGASWLVIGRPIYAAGDPRAAAEKILASLA